MKWSEFKENVDGQLNGRDPEIDMIDFWIFPEMKKINVIVEDNELTVIAEG